jgi:hypothetical protein
MMHCADGCRKDYGASRVVSSMLQLNTQMHLVLDETCLESWQFMRNVAALGMLISQQKVDCDFEFYKLEYQTDVPVLVLSERKPLLPVSVNDDGLH